jgi:tryptophan halogenase
MEHDPISKLVIVGGGTAGWMAATLISKLMGGQLAIELVESDAIGTVGVGEATIPPIQVYNELAGVDENAFLRATKGTIKLAIEFQNWGALGDRYFHSFGFVGRKVGAITFQHVYLRALAAGVAGPLPDYSLNSLAAAAGRFAPIKRIEGAPLPGITYAYHFDAGLYAGFLRGLSEAAGVRRREGRIESVSRDPDTGDIAALRLEDGSEVQGDFFIDCTGFRSLLLGQTLGVPYEEWSDWLFCDRAVAVPCSNVPQAMRPYTQSIAHQAGWQWRIPLQHRTGNGHVFCSDFISEDEATRVLLDNLEGEPLREPFSIRFKPGCRRQLWAGNCVAVGLSSGFIEPLESTSIHLIQIGITNLLKSFPTRGGNAAKAREYNRRMRFEYERIRDFIVLHYHLTARDDSPFWDRCRTMAVPDTLAAKMQLFAECGHLPRIDDELFAEVGWLQVMMGQGLRPRSYNPLADTLSTEQVAEYLRNFHTVISSTVDRLPPYTDYLKQFAV